MTAAMPVTVTMMVRGMPMRKMVGIGICLARTLEEQCVARLQLHLARGRFDALATSCHSHQYQIVVPFKRTTTDGFPNEPAAEIDKGDALFVVLVDLVHRTDVMVCSNQIVRLLQLEDLINLTSVHQTVATHHELILAED